jgi:hypothetical protein
LKIIGHLGSSIFINIAVIIKIGENKIIPIIQDKRSNNLFIIIPHSESELFLISKAGILFTSDIVVFDFAKSNELAIYLYLIQKILINSHNSSISSFLYELLT